MINSSQIAEHMDVVGSDGGHVGKVDHVLGSQIELAKLDVSTMGSHKMIPLSWVDHVDDKVHLSLPKDQARELWSDKPH